MLICSGSINALVIFQLYLVFMLIYSGSIDALGRVGQSETGWEAGWHGCIGEDEGELYVS